MKLILTILRPKKLAKVVVFFTAVAVFTVSLWDFALPVNAATGINKTINFQGKLVDNNGLNVANGTYSVVFSLYDDGSLGTNSPCTGHCIWTETDSVTTANGDGLFQVQLGLNTALPGAVDFNTDNIYLGIQVSADAEMTPRIQFTAVPYAFNAQKVAGLTVTNTTGTLTIPNGKTISFADAFSTSGAFGLTLTTTATTNATLPSGTITLVDLASTQTLTSKTIGSTGLTFSGSGTDVTTGTNEDFTISPNGSGDVILTSDPDTAVLIGSAGNTPAPLSVSGGIGSNAALIVNNTNSGDLFVASAAGVTKLRVANNGDLFLVSALSANGSTGAGQCLIGGAIASWGACSGLNYLRLNQGAISLVNDTADFLYGNAATNSAKFKLSTLGTGPVASVAGSTSFAALAVNNSGAGDLFTASKSGATKFSIANNGNIQFAGTTNFLNTITTAATAARTYTLPNATGVLCVSGDSCATSGIVGYLQRTAGGLAPSNITDDLFLGGTSTASAKFAFINNIGTGEPTASIAGSITLRNGVGQINRLNGGSLNFQTSPGGDAGLSTKFYIANNGNIGIGTNNTTPFATLDVKGNSGTLPAASFSAQTSLAGLIVDNTGFGDLFTASKSGATKFVVTNAGNVGIGTNLPSTMLDVSGSASVAGSFNFRSGAGTIQTTGRNTLTLGGSTTGDISLQPGGSTALYLASNGIVTLNASTYTTCGTLMTSANAVVCGGAAGLNYLRLNQGAISLVNDTADFLYGNAATNSAKFKLSTLGTGPVASVAGSTSFAALAVNNSGAGDLFTASKSGATKFSIANNGNIQFAGTTNFLNTITTAATAARTYTLPNATGTLCVSGDSCASSGVVGYLQRTAGGLAPSNITDDLFLGGTSTASAKFAFINNIGTGEPTASIAGSITLRNGVGQINRLNGGSLNFQTSPGGDAGLSTKFYIANNGNIGIGTNNTTPLATLDVKGNSGTLPAASFSAQTSLAGLIVDNTGFGDLFTASKSGATKFVVTNAGNVGIGTNLPTAVLDVAGTASLSGGLSFRTGAGAIQTTGRNTLTIGGATTGDVSFQPGGSQALYLASNGNISLSASAYANCAALATVSNAMTCSSTAALNYLRLASGAFSLINDTADFLFGSSASSSADFKLSTLGTGPVASVAGSTSFAAMVVDQTGPGDLFTASKSGSTKFTITNSGTLVAGPDAAGTIANGLVLPNTLAHFSGNIGSYAQVNAQNRSNGGSASTDFVATADNGNDSVNYIDFGINSSAYADGAYTIGGINDGYLYNNGGNLSVGTQTSGKVLKFHTGGTLAANERMRIDSNGNIAINNTTPQAVLDVRGVGISTLSSTIPVASISGATNFAAMVVNNTGAGDLFTASKSGATKFVVTNAGDVGIGVAAPAAKLDIFTGVTANTTAVNAIGSINDFLQMNIQNTSNGIGAQSGYSATADNGTATTNFMWMGINNSGYNNPQTYNVGAAGDGNILSLDNDLDIANGTAGKNIYFFTGGTAASNRRMVIDGNGNVGINTTSPLATFDVRAKSATTAIASVAGSTNFAALVVNNSGAGDLITASKSGLTRFTVKNNGNVLFGGETISASGSGATNNGSPAVVNGLGDTGSLIPNASFEANSGSVGFADGWTSAASNSAAVTLDTTTAAHGNNSAKVVVTNTSTAFYSPCVPVAAVTTTNYNLGWYYKVTAAPLPTVRANIDQYTSKNNCIANSGAINSAVSGPTIAVNANFLQVNPAAVTMTAGTTWARVHFFVACTTGCASSTVNIDGVRLIENSTTTSGLDYAENYPADPISLPQPGDVVSLQPVGKASQVTKANMYMDSSVIGVVSTHPGYVLDDGSMDENKVAVALAGRIPTNVSTQNGDIHIGDYLTSSTIPGVAVKAITAGPVIGQAMDEYTESDPQKIGQVVVFVKNTYFDGIPSGFTTGLVTSNEVNDLRLLGTIVSASTRLASESATTIITGDRVVAGLSVVSPLVTTKTLLVNTIKPAEGNSVTMQLGDGGSFVIQSGSNSAKFRFDSAGNAFFAGTITADKIVTNHIEGLSVLETKLATQESKTASLSALLSKMTIGPTETLQQPQSPTDASIAAVLAKYDANLVSIQGLSVEQNAKVAGNLRVQGNGLIEGILNVVDMLTANNLIVNKVADFLGTVIFHGDVVFQGTPIFNTDTAGTATILKGSDRVEVTFTKAYEQVPVVSANIVIGQITKAPNQSDQDMETAQKNLETKTLAHETESIVTRSSTKGFVILLKNPAEEDLTFSWTALAVTKQKEYMGSKSTVPTQPVPTPQPSVPLSPPTIQSNSVNSQKAEEGGDTL